jgi:Transmembrane amino acid transporter protein
VRQGRQSSIPRIPGSTAAPVVCSRAATNLALEMNRGGGVHSRAGSIPPRPVSALEKSPNLPVGTASIPNEVFNVIKSIVGAGVLGLPAGIAAFGNAPSALIPALFLLVAIGTLAGYGFSMIGTVCSYTRAISYRQAWSKTMGESTSWIPAVACLMVTACTVLTYSMILADTIPLVIRAVTGISGISRPSALLGTTTFVLLPLCLMKQLSSLAPFSLAGILGMVYTSAAMIIRWALGSYVAPSGPLYKSIAQSPLAPSFGTAGWKAVFSPNTALLVSMLSTAYM